jgi:hypothetical protein
LRHFARRHWLKPQFQLHLAIDARIPSTAYISYKATTWLSLFGYAYGNVVARLSAARPRQWLTRHDIK